MSEVPRAGYSRRRPDPVELNGLQPMSTTRLSDEVAERIRSLIITENIAAGSRLPSERDLAERVGASRPTVSQALRSLSLMGLVEIRRGSGAYVVRRPESMVTASVTLMLDLDERSATDLMQLRFWLETLGTTVAAQRTPPLRAEVIEEMREALQRLADAARQPSQWIAADTVFHATIVRASGNAYLGAVYESVHTTLLSAEYKQWVQSDKVPRWLSDSSPAQQLALHQPILDAVLARDPDAVRVAVETHHRVMEKHLTETLSHSRQRD
ncbi:FadR/GntR family transcriptional regulator [Streptomyces sp. NPDC048448]|uniref:FadR/GntR family transcriptional regulator n=1 Tax=Streptomyces sp. NPDC048448 TaxID=3365554 RepID=UPI00371F791B